jgi:TRAP-type uncharacterized transport system substrate-binding protein
LVVKLKIRHIAGLIALSFALIGVIASEMYESSKIHRLTLAAGSKTGESFILSAALKTVVERHNPHLQIEVVETGGTAQADAAAGPSARIVSVLYDDTFQILTRRDSPARSFTDLPGKTIGLARTGGQYQSFRQVAQHFGWQESDFRFIGASDDAADEAFAAGQAIQQMMRSGNVRLMRVDQIAEAIPEEFAQVGLLLAQVKRPESQRDSSWPTPITFA